MAHGDSTSLNNPDGRDTRTRPGSSSRSRRLESHSGSTSSSSTIRENEASAPNNDDAPPPFISLAGSRQAPNQGIAYLHPDYMKYNPLYGQKHRDGPIWSLATPLPRVVRDGMRWTGPQPEDENEGKDTQPGDQGPPPRPNAHNPPEPAENEPPAWEPPDKEAEQGKKEAQHHTADDSDFFNKWGKWRHHVRQELAEWLGVTISLTLGMCAGLSTYTSKNPYEAGTFPSLAAAWGFSFMIAIYVAGGISGGHLNPAISIAMCVWRGFPKRRTATYVVAQVLGAITASGIAYAIYHDAIVRAAALNNVPQAQSPAKDGMVTLPKEFVNPASAFFTEFVGTAILVGVIMALGDDTNAPPGAGMQAFIIGILIGVLILSLGYTTGGCFNPARDFGARIVVVMAGWGGQVFTQGNAWWIWGPWAADISGGLFGAFLYDLTIFTGGESPINYPPRRRKRAMLLKQRNLRKKARLGQGKVPDLERAADEMEHDQ
ncbi:aquaporin-like protein [Aspergillus egyptiacus]|nr:aquaporin-like protein [Aspergillus egyptiacus]